MHLPTNSYVAMNIQRLIKLSNDPSYKLTEQERKALDEYRRNRIKHTYTVPKHSTRIQRHDPKLKEKSDA